MFGFLKRRKRRDQKTTKRITLKKAKSMIGEEHYCSVIEQLFDFDNGVNVVHLPIRIKDEIRYLHFIHDIDEGVISYISNDKGDI